LQFDHPAPLRAVYLGKTTVAGLTPVATFPDGLGRTTTLFEFGR
jgi:hypothetical protein